MIKKLQTGGTADQYQKAKKWTTDYVNSPKYKERLTKQVNTEKMLDGGAELASPSSIIKKRSEVLNYVKPEYVKGDIANTKGLLGDYSSADSILRIRTDLGDATPTLVHELSHATLNGDAPFSTKFNDSYVNKLMVQPGGSKFTNRWDPYLQKPTEIKGRLDSLRYQMKSKGIYDAGTQDFSSEHLQKMRADKDIVNSEDYKSLESQLPQGRKDYGMSWLMNNIAKNKQTSTLATYAKDGGVLRKYIK